MSPIPANDDCAVILDVNTARDLAAAIAARMAADAAAPLAVICHLILIAKGL